MNGVMTSADRAAAECAHGFIASSDPGAGIVVLARGRGRAQALAAALPAAIESAVFESVPADPGSEAASWPAPVRSVISFLGALHHDLRTGAANARQQGAAAADALDVLVAIAAGDRMHVVVAGRVVGFRGHRGHWERLAPLGERARRPLGLDPKARIEVTSEPYAPGDLFLAIPDGADPADISLEVAPPFAVTHAIAQWAQAEQTPAPDAGIGPYAALAWAVSAPVTAGHLPGTQSALDLDDLDELPELTTLEELAELPESESTAEFEPSLPEPSPLAKLRALPVLERAIPEPVLAPAPTLGPPPPPPPFAPPVDPIAPAVAAVAPPVAPPPPPPPAAPTPAPPAAGVLPAWLLERAAKDVEQGARIDEVAPAAPAEIPQAAMFGNEFPEPEVELRDRRRSFRRLTMLGGIAIALLVPIGLGLGWRPPLNLSWLKARPAATPPNTATPAPIQAGAGGAQGPGTADLVAGSRPWQRVVAGAVAAESPSATNAALAGDPTAVGEGRIEARTEPFIAGVTVTVDGKAIGKAPVSLDGIPAGKHLVGFDGGNGRRWEEEVNVIANEVAIAIAPLGAPETQGLVEVIATRMNNDGPSDEEVQVLVDGEVRGATPLDLKLDPGTHAVALDLGGDRVIYRVIEVRPGDKQVLDVPVDAPPPFVIEHRAAANLAGDGTVILTVQVKGPSASATYLNLHVEENGVFKAYPMGPVPGAPGTYAVGLPVSRELHGKRLRYYFATAAEGETPVVTKIFVVPLR